MQPLPPLPGPKAKEIINRDHEVVSPSYPRVYPFVMDHGSGVYVWDVDGNRYLDFAAGIAVTSTGHSHPKVVKAIQDQAEKFFHISFAISRRFGLFSVFSWRFLSSRNNMLGTSRLTKGFLIGNLNIDGEDDTVEGVNKFRNLCV